MRVASYLRVSSLRQVKESESLSGQRYQIEQWAIREGHTLVKEFCDEGFSAFKGFRPAYSTMIEEATSGYSDFEAIVVYNLSRFSRDFVRFIQVKEKLDNAGVRLFSVNEPIPNDQKTGRLITAICSAINQNQSEQTSETVRDRLTETARQGYFCGGYLPYGYRSEKAPNRDSEGSKKERKILVIDSLEAEVVKRIFNMSLSGNNGLPMGVKKIAAKLNEEGVTFKGRKWSFNKVDKILRDSTYFGERVYGQKRKLGDTRHPPIIIQVPQIITKELFDEVGKGLSARRPGQEASRGPFNSTMLSGLLVCSVCGCHFRLTTGKSGRYHYYSCSHKVSHHVDSCNTPRIPRSKLEGAVISMIKTILLDETRLKSLTENVRSKISEKKKNLSLDKLKIDRNIANLERKLSNLYDLLADDKITLDEYLSNLINSLKKQIDSLRDKKVEIDKICSSGVWNYGQQQIANFIENSFQILASDNPNTIKAFLKSIIHEIVVYPKVVKVIGGNNILVEHMSKAKKMGTSVEVPTSLTIWRRERDSNPR